jgi:hypothetical protein
MILMYTSEPQPTLRIVEDTDLISQPVVPASQLTLSKTQSVDMQQQDLLDEVHYLSVVNSNNFFVLC